jgi:hypothetical protein
VGRQLEKEQRYEKLWNFRVRLRWPQAIGDLPAKIASTYGLEYYLEKSEAKVRRPSHDRGACQGASSLPVAGTAMIGHSAMGCIFVGGSTGDVGTVKQLRQSGLLGRRALAVGHDLANGRTVMFLAPRCCGDRRTSMRLRAYVLDGARSSRERDTASATRAFRETPRNSRNGRGMPGEVHDSPAPIRQPKIIGL